MLNIFIHITVTPVTTSDKDKMLNTTKRSTVLEVTEAQNVNGTA